MLKELVTTNKNRLAYAKTLLLNTNRITDFYELGKYAAGVITITSYANLVSGTDDTITVAGTLFTSQTGGATPGEPTFQAVTDNDTTATSLAAQINAFDEAGALLVNRVTATADGATVTITADAYGTAANAYTLAYSDEAGGIGAKVSGATLSGGLASTTKFWYNERKNDRRDRADEYITSETYPLLKSAMVDGSDIQNARIELTTTLRNDEAFVKTLNVNLDDIVKVIDFDGANSRVWLARGAFAIDEYLVTHTLGAILLLQNAIYKRGVAGVSCVAEEYGNGDYHKTILTLTDWTTTVPANVEGVGATIYTAPGGYITVEYGEVDLLISSDASTDTPELGLGTIVATGDIATLEAGDVDMEDIHDGVAITAITPAGSATTVQFKAETDNDPFDGSGTAMPIFLNFADTWTGAGDVVVNGTITLYWRHSGD